MGVQIIEQFICSKYPDQKKCEDGLLSAMTLSLS